MILYYLVTHQPEVPAHPLAFYGPISQAECKALEDDKSKCYAFVVRKPKQERLE